MRRSVPVATAATLVLVLLGTPFLGVRFGTVDDRALPAESTSRAVSEQLRRDFAANEGDAFPVVTADAGSGTVLGATIDSYASGLSRLDGVSRVDAREEGLRVPPKHRKRARVCSSTTPADGLAVTSPDRVRALDYQFDVTATGRVIKILMSSTSSPGSRSRTWSSTPSTPMPPWPRSTRSSAPEPRAPQ